MTTRDVNLINIALMVITAFLAWERPAEVFLFAYAVLGPLHYLTEISWLERRDWFSTSRRDWIWPSVVAAASMGLHIWITSKATAGEPLSTAPAIGTHPARGGQGFYLSLFDGLTWSVVATTLAAAFVARASLKTAVVIVVAIAGVAWLQFESARLFTGVFLPTLIHVYVFTGCFMLYGALKSRSTSGYLSCLAHLGIGAFLLFAPDGGAGVVLPYSADPAENIDAKLGSFVMVLGATSRLLGYGTVGPEAREGILNAFRFMAYAYTYHYLNWFAKTGIIRWHDVRKERLWLIVAIWLGSVILYAVDWKAGFTALLGLSLAHVFLEFPLNWRTFVGIGTELKARVVGQAPDAAR